MKTIIKNLEEQREILQDLIQAREDKFYDRSEKWQESEKGQEWEDKTMDIQTQCDELEIIIDELKNLL